MFLFAAIIFLLAACAFAALWRGERAARRRDGLKHDLLQVEVDTALESRWRTHMLDQLANGIEDGLLIVSPDMAVMYMNQGAVRFLPVSSASVGRPLLECVRDHRVADLVAAAKRTGRRIREELLQSSADGDASEPRVFSLEVVPLHDERRPGLQLPLLVILRDETEKRSLEKIRRDFVANASHELRTPLSIIAGYLENLLAGDITDEAQQKRVFSLMQKHGQRLARIVEDMLVISRLESGDGVPLKLEPLDLQTCAEDVAQLLANAIATSGARVRIIVADGTSPVLEGDRYYWEQIFFNLIENALKENPAGGLEITVRIERISDELEVSIRDNGVGIPAADQPFVFKRFYRVSTHRSKQVKGTGLGLSIVKRAVEAHHGTITLRSQPGIETVFSIRLPAVKLASTPGPT
ncbi:MAG: PAS domain-containing sensor histidine kinase [Verrucomicrobiaceae bacterium]|nr:PAS domain-containing sensor histidine kinase [Verrucomicrobiaceae bacterium]